MFWKSKGQRIKYKSVQVSSKALFGKSQLDKTLEKYVNAGWEMVNKTELFGKPNHFILHFQYTMSPEEIAAEDKRNLYRNIAIGVLGLSVFLCVLISSVQQRQAREAEGTRNALLPTLVQFPTSTDTAIPSDTPTNTASPVPSDTATASPSPSSTPTHTPLATASATSSNTPAFTPSATITNTVTSAFTNTPRSLPTATITNTSLPVQTNPIPTSSTGRELIGQEIALFTVLIEVFDPPVRYRALVDVNSHACASACRIVGEFTAGQEIAVTGLVCNPSSGSIWYRVYDEGGWFGVGAGDAFISQTALRVDRTMESVDGIDYAARYSCSAPASRPAPTARPSGGNGSGGGSGGFTNAPGNCATAVASGMTAEQAAAAGLDRDGDGVACYGD